MKCVVVIALEIRSVVDDGENDLILINKKAFFKSVKNSGQRIRSDSGLSTGL